MKTIIAERRSAINECEETLTWYFVADSALVNTGKAFYLPEFADEYEAFLVAVVKINRIGKSIGARFAGRYYSEVAAGIHFRASALRRQLLAAGLPTDPSHSFDRSLTVGEFIPAEEFTGTLHLNLNGKQCATLPLDSLSASTARLLEKSSTFNTVKMGDLLIPELSGGIAVKIGDIIDVSLNDRPLFDIHIK